MARTRTTSAIVTRYSGAARKLTTLLAALTTGMKLEVSCLDGSRDAAVLADAPEVHGHQERRDERDPDAVEDVEAKERACSDEPAAQEREARVVRGRDELDVSDLEQTGPRSFDPEERRRRRHVRPDRDRPDRQLVPGKEVAGEREEERQHEQDDADDPVELARRLVRAGHEDAEHVDPD